MTQLAIYLDSETARLLNEAARIEGVSRSAMARKAIQNHLHRRLPQSFFDVLGTWDDSRSPEELLEAIRSGPHQPTREPIG
jgi:hypothetical protein